MEWITYWRILRRRWWLIAAILFIDVLASSYLYRRSVRAAGFQSCLTVYVADVSSPSLISATNSTLQSTGALLAGETAANFFADDLLDVAQSSLVSTYVSRHLQGKNVPGSTPVNLAGSVSGTRRDRTVDLCVTSADAGTAQAAATVLGVAVTRDRARFIGRSMAKRTFVQQVSGPSTAPVSTSHDKLNLVLRLFLGLAVALGAVLLWDALDPTIRDERDTENVLGAPVLARVRR